MFTLTYLQDGVWKSHELSPGETVLGRGSSCDLVIDDASVSRRHAAITVTASGCVLTDFGSRNCTYRNGEIVDQAELVPGDEVVVGQVRFIFQQGPELQVHLAEESFRPTARICRNVDWSDSGTTMPSPPRSVDVTRLLKIVSEITGITVKMPTPREVVDRIFEVIFEQFPAERAFVILNDKTTDTLVPFAARSREPTASVGQATISRTVINQVISERVAILASDVALEPLLASVESIRIHAIRALMCSPLWNQQGVIGALYVDSPRSRNFSSVDLDLLTILSNCAAAAIEQARRSAELVEEVKRRERLQRYHSPAVVRRILDSGEGDASWVTQEREVSILFADLADFTSLAENRSPTEVVLLLNRFFEAMTDIIFQNEGTLDKFIGDAILAVFGAPFDQPDHALRCVKTALSMRSALDLLNSEWTDVPLRMRVAINTGIAFTGDIGSSRRREFTIIGDVVNAASRIQATLTKPGQIVITRATLERVDGQVTARPIGMSEMRGRSRGLELFEVG